MVTSFLSTVTAFLLLLSLDVGLQSLHPDAERLSGAGQPAYLELWPQQWRFFSDYADRDLVVGYDIQDAGGKAAPVSAQHASASDLWGIRLTSDALMDDLSYLAGSVPAKAWLSCDALSAAACLSRALTNPEVTLVDRYSGSMMCGVHLLALESPELASGNDEPRRATLEVARIRVNCLES